MPKKKVSFEESLARLEEIVGKLENGEGDLDGMLKLYEEGIALIRVCNTQLQEAEQKVKMLAMQADGTVVLTDFNQTEEE
jgi:exodeoxyribonuclease VII small subunit